MQCTVLRGRKNTLHRLISKTGIYCIWCSCTKLGPPAFPPGQRRDWRQSFPREGTDPPECVPCRCGSWMGRVESTGELAGK